MKVASDLGTLVQSGYWYDSVEYSILFQCLELSGRCMAYWTQGSLYAYVSELNEKNLTM